MIDGGCQTFASDCHVRAAAELVGHRWDPVVLAALRAGSVRRSELLRSMAGASDKALTESLRRLARRGLVARARAAERPDGAVYELTELGASFAEGPLAHLASWAAENQERLAASS